MLAEEPVSASSAVTLQNPLPGPAVYVNDAWPIAFVVAGDGGGAPQPGPLTWNRTASPATGTAAEVTVAVTVLVLGGEVLTDEGEALTATLNGAGTGFIVWAIQTVPPEPDAASVNMSWQKPTDVDER